MTITLTLSEASSGNPMADTIDMGEVTPGNDADYKNVFLSHDAIVNPITDCSIYAIRYAGSNYLGIDADADFTEIMGWGDAVTGGVKIIMDGWSGWTSGENTAGTWLTLKNGYGDIDSQIPLDKDSVTVGTPTVDGEIPVGGESHVQVKATIPSSVPAGAGYRAFSMVFAYSATS
jgi:hypothetical protein